MAGALVDPPGPKVPAEVVAGKGGERPGTHADPGYLGAVTPEHRQERPAKDDREQESDGAGRSARNRTLRVPCRVADDAVGERRDKEEDEPASRKGNEGAEEHRGGPEEERRPERGGGEERAAGPREPR